MKGAAAGQFGRTWTPGNAVPYCDALAGDGVGATTNHEESRYRAISIHAPVDHDREASDGIETFSLLRRPHLALSPEGHWRELWLTVSPIWIVLASSRVIFYGLERLRHAEHIPPVSADAILSIILWPLVVAGSHLTLRSWQRSGLAQAAIVALVSALLFSAGARPIHAIISAQVFGHAGAQDWIAAADATTPAFWQSWLATTVEYSVLYLSSVLGAVGVLSYRSLMNERLLRAKAEAASIRERLRALRMQLNPHFLFNALNSIVGATYTDPNAAQEFVARLSEVLRQTLHASEQEQHEFRDELQVVEAYVRMEQSRTHSRVRLRSCIDPECARAAVPSLLLLPLIENAVKHGVRGSACDVTIDVYVSRRSDDLRIGIINTLPLSATDSHAPLPGGLGLRNVRERLKVLFGSRATLVVAQPDPSQFEVRITLPYREPPDSATMREHNERRNR